MPRPHRRAIAATGLILALTATACSTRGDPGGSGAGGGHATGSSSMPSMSMPGSGPSGSDRPAGTTSGGPLPGMPAPLSADDVYAADRPGLLSPVVRHFPRLVYVPNGMSNTVDVIDQRTFRIVGHYPVGRTPQHVVPSWDLRTLWVNNNSGNSLTPFDPATGRPGRAVPVDDPYNLYFTPDGRYAMVMAEARRRIDFRDPHTMALRRSVHVPCAGVNHVDFSADGRYFLASCEFSGQLIKVDVEKMTVLGTLSLGPKAMPQDVKVSPDGRVFYSADMAANGVWLVDGASFRRIGFVHTGAGAHGLYVTRDSRDLLVTNRGEGSVSVLDLATRRVVRTWHIPGGGSPDMGGLDETGKVFWVSGRYSSEVYAIDIVHWRLLARIRVGSGPHGLCVYPQPGRYSLGHTGVFR